MLTLQPYGSNGVRLFFYPTSQDSKAAAEDYQRAATRPMTADEALHEADAQGLMLVPGKRRVGLHTYSGVSYFPPG